MSAHCVLADSSILSPSPSYSVLLIVGSGLGARAPQAGEARREASEQGAEAGAAPARAGNAPRDEKTQ